MDENADSGFDIDGAMDTISNDLFGQSEEPNEETEEVSAEPSEHEEDTEEVENTEETTEEVVEKLAPQSWKKEMHEYWGKLDPNVQEYIELREAQMREGLDKNKEDSTLGRTIRDVMSPYSEVLKNSNIDGPTMVRNLLNAHYNLSTSNPEKRAQLMRDLAQSYGVSLSGQQSEPNQELTQLQNKINGLEYQLGQFQQTSRQEAESKVAEEVNQFAEKHEYFKEVSEQLVAFINAGESLEDAYEKAVWANPVTRQKEIDRVSKEKIEAQKAKLAEKTTKAKKAKSVNVSSRDTAKAPTGLIGTMEDTLRDTYREIQTRE